MAAGGKAEDKPTNMDALPEQRGVVEAQDASSNANLGWMTATQKLLQWWTTT
jgi:hypothetical protein